jgi:hypothetical protein
MPIILICPSCGNKGEASIDENGAFEVRGQFQGKAIRKCRKCGVGLEIGPFSGGFFGKPRLIPKDLWQRMEEVWKREFGSG